MKNIALELAKRINDQFNVRNQKTIIVGVNGAQGSGKSTLSRALKLLLEDQFQLSSVVISLDDIYKTKAEREVMVKTIHPLFVTRGVPGTHDVAWGIDILTQLKSSTADSKTTIPVFNKAIDDGASESEWQVVQGKIDVVIFEGWCVGAKPQTAAELIEPVNELERVEDTDGVWRNYANAILSTEYQELFGLIDILIMLKVVAFSAVYKQRLEQEEALVKTSNNQVMSEHEIKRFVDHYQRLTEHMLLTLPVDADVVIVVDSEHNYLLS